MFPVLFEFYDTVIPSWHVMVAIGGIAGYFLFSHNADPRTEQRDVKTIFAVGYISALFGARWFSVFVEETHDSFSGYLEAIFSMGSMTFYGGALFGGLCVYVVTLIKGHSARRVLDLAIPALLLGLFFGRIGCFLNGDDYGIPYPNQESPPWWAYAIPVLNDGIARYPVQIFESTLSLLLAVSLSFLNYLKFLKPGLVGAFGILGYSISRFFIEFYRGDYRGPTTLPLSPSQIISLVLLVVTVAYIGFIRTKPPRPC